MAKRPPPAPRVLQSPPKNLGNFRGKAKREEWENNNTSDDDILDIWHPYRSNIRCRECKKRVVEKLQDVSILDTYRCPEGHKTWRLA